MAHKRNKRCENFFLAIEIGVESAERHTRPVGDSTNGRLVITFLAELEFSGLQQLLPGALSAGSFRHLART